MGRVYFRKNVNRTIFISDSYLKHQITHQYFPLNESEIPYDSSIFRNLLNNGDISVISFTDTNNKSIDWNKYKVVDKVIEQRKEEGKKAEIKNKLTAIKEEKKLIEKKEKEKKKEEKKKQKEKEIKEKPVIVDDFEIEQKLK